MHSEAELAKAIDARLKKQLEPRSPSDIRMRATLTLEASIDGVSSITQALPMAGTTKDEAMRRLSVAWDALEAQGAQLWCQEP